MLTDHKKFIVRIYNENIGLSNDMVFYGNSETDIVECIQTQLPHYKLVFITEGKE